MNNQSSTGLHAYLDVCALRAGLPLTDEQIILYKKEYRKEYLKNYKKSYRKKHSCISISLTSHENALFIENVKQSGLKARNYIKNCLLKKGQNNQIIHLKESIFQVIDLLDECIYNQNSHTLPLALSMLNEIKNSLP